MKAQVSHNYQEITLQYLCKSRAVGLKIVCKTLSAKPPEISFAHAFKKPMELHFKTSAHAHYEINYFSRSLMLSILLSIFKPTILHKTAGAKLEEECETDC